MSPLTAVLSLLVFIAIPALIYAFFFAINCPQIPLRRSERRRSQLAGPGQLSSKDSKQAEEVVFSADVKYGKGADHEEEYGSECPVCLSAFVEGDFLRQLNGCKHSFHAACIDKWLSSHSNCPVCRACVPTPASTPRTKQRPTPAAAAAAAAAGNDDFRQGLPDAASLV